jgi:predicted Zn finger-like uncharacterized protein
VKVICPKCKAVYSINGPKIDFNGRKTAKCVKCKSRFYIEKREDKQKGDKKPSRITFMLSYFEKRRCDERRKGFDRREKIEKNDLPFTIPQEDFIPIVNKEGHSVGYVSPGRREAGDRRTGIERRRSLTN